MATFFTVVFLAFAFPLLAFDISQSTRCVTIPDQMKVCRDVGYSEMRLPNFLGHSNLEAEVVPHSEDWRPLLQTGCHPQAQAFLCSIIAPVCLDAFIQPCRSLCVAVRDSCAPVLACQGHLWPEALDCNRFPDEEDMCLTPYAKLNHYAKDLPKPACQNCPSIEDAPAMKTVLSAFCQHDFAVTAKIRRFRHPGDESEFQVEGRVEFIRQGPLLPYDTQHLLQQWLLINVRCASALVRPARSQLYVLTGSVQPDGTIALIYLFPWHKKDAGIALATRKWKHHRC
ncbi:Secreted frizzled-related protein 5 [Oryzias melastigma]|uniref:Secreted frizzled-related protein 5 n=1 Tax=Oryzias melastigma TaxID=30732 RepID=A0A834BL41_ORYME|nr:Secreted frizzled-related protein 5 [Oryzias melastigma]